MPCFDILGDALDIYDADSTHTSLGSFVLRAVSRWVRHANAFRINSTETQGQGSNASRIPHYTGLRIWQRYPRLQGILLYLGPPKQDPPLVLCLKFRRSQSLEGSTLVSHCVYRLKHGRPFGREFGK